MVFSRRQTVVSLLLLLSLIVSARSQSAVDKTATSTINGKVTVGGKGLQGVVVALALGNQTRSNLRPTRFRSTTDEDGNYRIKNVPPGTYEVVTASPAYVAIEGRKPLIVSTNETLENIDITLARGGVITGRVTDADGNPVIEETVNLNAVTTTNPPFHYRNIRTDDRGIYRAYGVPAGKYTVSSGRDTNTSVGSRRSEGGFQRTYHPSAVDRAAATVIEVSEGSEATNVDITFGGPTRKYTASGRIIDSETNQPVPKTSVGMQVFLQQGGSSTVGGIAESTKDGEFKVENLPPGKYAVYSQPPADSDWHSEAVPFEVTDRDVEGLVIKISKGASVSGVVILEGTDDPNVRANLLAARIVGQILDGYSGQSTLSATINPNGSFRLTGLAPGHLMFDLQPHEPLRVIRVECDGMPYPRGVEIKEREQVTGLRVVVGLANGAIRGVIRLPDGLELPSLPRLRVGIRRTENFAPGYTPVETDLRGQFRVDGLIPGTYEILVTVLTPPDPPRIRPARQTVMVTNGAAADVTILLQMLKPPQ